MVSFGRYEAREFIQIIQCKAKDRTFAWFGHDAQTVRQKKLQKEWLQLCDRIEAALEGYTDEDD